MRLPIAPLAPLAGDSGRCGVWLARRWLRSSPPGVGCLTTRLLAAGRFASSGARAFRVGCGFACARAHAFLWSYLAPLCTLLFVAVPLACVGVAHRFGSASGGVGPCASALVRTVLGPVGLVLPQCPRAHVARPCPGCAFRSSALVRTVRFACFLARPALPLGSASPPGVVGDSVWGADPLFLA